MYSVLPSAVDYSFATKLRLDKDHSSYNITTRFTYSVYLNSIQNAWISLLSMWKC